MRAFDTPKTVRKLICIWLLVIHSVILNAPLQASNNINEIDKYKIYIHMKVMNYKEFICINKLWTKENRSWDPYAKNPKSSAFGIPQLLKLKETNPYVQMDLGYKYVLHRYSKRGKDGAACNALAFHLRNGWY
jgi:hypothetical protein